MREITLLRASETLPAGASDEKQESARRISRVLR
jgi:hypothetical protein